MKILKITLFSLLIGVMFNACMKDPVDPAFAVWGDAHLILHQDSTDRIFHELSLGVYGNSLLSSAGVICPSGEVKNFTFEKLTNQSRMILGLDVTNGVAPYLGNYRFFAESNTGDSAEYTDILGGYSSMSVLRIDSFAIEAYGKLFLAWTPVAEADMQKIVLYDDIDFGTELASIPVSTLQNELSTYVNNVESGKKYYLKVVSIETDNQSWDVVTYDYVEFVAP